MSTTAFVAGLKDATVSCAEEVVKNSEEDLGDRACKLGVVGGAGAAAATYAGVTTAGVTGIAAGTTATTYVGGTLLAIGAAGTAATVGAAAVGVGGAVVGIRKISHLNLGFCETCPYPFRVFTPNDFEFSIQQYKDPSGKQTSDDAVDIAIGLQPEKVEQHTKRDSFAPHCTFCHQIVLQCDNGSDKGWNTVEHFRDFKKKVGSDKNYICARVGQWRNNVSEEGTFAGGDAKVWAKVECHHIDLKSKAVVEFEFFVMMRAENINADHVWYLGSPKGRRVGNAAAGHLKIPSKDGSCHIEVHPVDTYAGSTIMGNFVSSNDAFSFTLKNTNLNLHE